MAAMWVGSVWFNPLWPQEIPLLPCLVHLRELNVNVNADDVVDGIHLREQVSRRQVEILCFELSLERRDKVGLSPLSLLHRRALVLCQEFSRDFTSFGARI